MNDEVEPDEADPHQLALGVTRDAGRASYLRPTKPTFSWRKR